MTFLPAVVQAQYRGSHRIRVVFNDGAQGTISFRRWLKGPVFEPLLDVDHFRRFYLDGGTVAWPNGADVAPETLYAAVARTRPRKRPVKHTLHKSPSGGSRRARQHRRSRRRV